MFEGVEAAGGHEVSRGTASSALARPIHAPVSIPKLGMIGAVRFHASARPHSTPVPRGPKIHLCVPATKKVAAEVLGARVLDAEAVHAVDAEQHAVGGIATGVHLFDDVRHGSDRQLDARARVDPR